jgi:NADPH:quinone reductase-like Zn-dependent oxidoreductase
LQSRFATSRGLDYPDASMLAAVAERYGSPEVVAVREMPEPAAGEGEVRVRVRASSLNPLDAKLRSGALRPFLRLRFPAILGFDLAGDVDAVGPAAPGFSVGDRVYGRIDAMTGGTHAELAVVAVRVLDRIPEGLSYEQAAALPLAGMTALQALQDIARIRPGHRLLINGGAGGVGAHAIQVGRAFGASVTAVVSTAAVPLALRLGAATVDYQRGEIERLERGFDVVFDTVFSRPFRDFVRLLDRGGVFVTTGFSPGLVAVSVLEGVRSGRRLAWVVSRADGRLMRELSALVSARKVQAVIDSTWPLDQIQEAYRRLEAGHAHGKIVITIP